MMSRIIRAPTALALVAGVSTVQAGPYSITLMDLAGGTEFQGWDVNNHGVFVGSATVGGAGVGYLVNAGVATTLSGPAGATNSASLGISNTGTVVGSFTTVAGGALDSGYIYIGGVYSIFNLPGAVATQLRGISPDGRYVTGYATMPTGFSSFVYDTAGPGSVTIIVNNSPFLTIAQGVTNAGVVVGNYRDGTGRHSFSYDSSTGTLTDFTIAGADMRARGINENGLIDGFFIDGTGQHSFVGSAPPFDVFDVLGGTDTTLEGINDDGWLAGYYTDAAGTQHAFLAQQVIEPASVALVLAAFGALLARRRRAPLTPARGQLLLQAA